MFEGFAFDIFHDDERLALEFAGFENLADVRMIDGCRRTSLARNPALSDCMFARGEEFQRYPAAEDSVFREKTSPIPPRPEPDSAR